MAPQTLRTSASAMRSVELHVADQTGAPLEAVLQDTPEEKPSSELRKFGGDGDCAELGGARRADRRDQPCLHR